ncbi:hypothetical protein GCM10023189_29790 [Nibrella saemangeumensis]|uniref:Outer membrane protein beta-barrel domain-containing protein n=1 Tax=Nibrella saemangeumensis TaxID=1084526 RepID=A0ABP8N0I9_9BACT
MKPTLAFLFMLLVPLFGSGQNIATTDSVMVSSVNTPRSLRGSWVNLRGGIMLPDFYKRSSEAVRLPVLQKPYLGWQAGLSVEVAHSRWHGSRIEVSFVRKGANELFAENGHRLESTTRLSYAQVALLPVIVKARGERFSPFLGIGGYGAYLLNATHQVRLNGAPAVPDKNLPNHFRKLDYGWTVGAGVYLGRRPLELRYESGLTDVFREGYLTTPVRNQAVSLLFSL